ncbi:hypothetical protein B7755_033855 [Streptomyces sp. NBS 14/10]|nr:hypothetical protein [Streptomyces sp. NBS 14/10]KAK1186548.1 hypothetical protein B7755_033855 [Streptomyces sp. NBS 14/10]
MKHISKVRSAGAGVVVKRPVGAVSWVVRAGLSGLLVMPTTVPLVA